MTYRRIVDYPYIVLRIDCRPCRRTGCYRLARLAEAHGAETELEELRRRLTADCPAWKQTGKRRRIIEADDCRAKFTDLAIPTPPDLPPGLGGLKVIDGGIPDDDPTPTPLQRRKAAE